MSSSPRSATAYINGPRSGCGDHRSATSLPTISAARPSTPSGGLAACVADDEDDALAALAELLSYLPDNHLSDPIVEPATDPPDRPSASPDRGRPGPPDRGLRRPRGAGATCVDHGSLLEVHAEHATNMVTAYGAHRRPSGRGRRQPAVRPRRHARHPCVSQGGPPRPGRRRLQSAPRDVRRHARLRARSRPRVAGHDPPRRRSSSTRMAKPPCRGSV